MDSNPFLNYLIYFLGMVRDNVYHFLGLSLYDAKFDDLGLAHKIGLFFAIVVVIRLIVWLISRSRKSFTRKHSGSSAYQKHATSRWLRFLGSIPAWLIVIPVLFMALSLADPYFAEVNKIKVMTSGRIRVEMRDTSTSMESLFSDTNITKAEVAEDHHLNKFLKMREGKGDRVSFWLFASNPYLIQDFVANDEFYRYKVANAPLVTSSTDRSDWADNYYDPNDFETPRSTIPLHKYGYIPGEGGGTALQPALRHIVNQFKADPVSNRTDPKTNRLPDRAILITTDAELDAFPEDELEELKRMGVRTYVVWISSGTVDAEAKAHTFLDRLAQYNGKYWDVRTPNALLGAYKAIDELEPANYEDVSIETKKDLSGVFLFCAVMSLVIVVFIGLLLLVRIGTSP